MIPAQSTFLTPINSSTCFDYIGYDQAAGELILCFDTRFKHKRHPLEAYFYPGVFESVYGALLSAPSKGSKFHDLRILEDDWPFRLGNLLDISFHMDGEVARYDGTTWYMRYGFVDAAGMDNVKVLDTVTFSSPHPYGGGYGGYAYWIQVSEYFPGNKVMYVASSPTLHNEHITGKYFVRYPSNVPCSWRNTPLYSVYPYVGQTLNLVFRNVIGNMLIYGNGDSYNYYPDWTVVHNFPLERISR